MIGMLHADMQRRADIGLNKGEACHALKNALRLGRQGEIHDRPNEGQHYRMAGLSLLAAIVTSWNTKSTSTKPWPLESAPVSPVRRSSWHTSLRSDGLLFSSLANMEGKSLISGLMVSFCPRPEQTLD